MRFLLILTAAVSLLASNARADILVTIDITNPAAVVFTATSAAPQSSGPNVPGTSGIDFLHFFAIEISGFALGLVSQSTFATYLDSSYPYLNWNTDNYSVDNVDLQFYSQKTSSQHFSTSDPAFVGTGTVDFSAYAAYLPTVGATGRSPTATLATPPATRARSPSSAPIRWSPSPRRGRSSPSASASPRCSPACAG